MSPVSSAIVRLRHIADPDHRLQRHERRLEPGACQHRLFDLGDLPVQAAHHLEVAGDRQGQLGRADQLAQLLRVHPFDQVAAELPPGAPRQLRLDGEDLGGAATHQLAASAGTRSRDPRVALG